MDHGCTEWHFTLPYQYSGLIEVLSSVVFVEGALELASALSVVSNFL
jgi:hypothetical protein